MSRNKLKQLGSGTRHVFRARFVELADKPGYKGMATIIRLRRVTVWNDGRRIPGCISFSWAKQFQRLGRLIPGQWIEFEARVARVESGYKGPDFLLRREKPLRVSWQLKNPTKIRLVGKEEMVRWVGGEGRELVQVQPNSNRQCDEHRLQSVTHDKYPSSNGVNMNKNQRRKKKLIERRKRQQRHQVGGISLPKDLIASVVHEAVCEFTGDDGFGHCAHYAVAGAKLLSVLTRKLYLPQAGDLQVFCDGDCGMMMDATEGGFGTGEFHAWIAGPVAFGTGQSSGRKPMAGDTTIIDFSSRHFRKWVETRPVFEGGRQVE